MVHPVQEILKRRGAWHQEGRKKEVVVTVELEEGKAGLRRRVKSQPLPLIPVQKLPPNLLPQHPNIQRSGGVEHVSTERGEGK